MVEKELLTQIKNGNYVVAKEKPLVVSPIAAIPKPDSADIRLIHDGSIPKGTSMNSYAQLQSVRYQTLEQATSLAKCNSYLAKVDLKAA